MYTEPQKPTSCCGRGCEHCVWISYFDAHNRWLELYKKDSCNPFEEKESKTGVQIPPPPPKGN